MEEITVSGEERAHTVPRLVPKRESCDEPHRFYHQWCRSVCRRGIICGAGATNCCLLFRLFVPDFGELPHQSAFANLGVMVALFASAILHSLNLAVYIHESVCIWLIVHDVSLLTRILLCGAS